MPHPRRTNNYRPVNIRLLAETEAYLNSIRQPNESMTALIRRIAEEHKELNILKRWEGK